MRIFEQVHVNVDTYAEDNIRDCKICDSEDHIVSSLEIVADCCLSVSGFSQTHYIIRISNLSRQLLKFPAQRTVDISERKFSNAKAWFFWGVTAAGFVIGGIMATAITLLGAVLKEVDKESNPITSLKYHLIEHWNAKNKYQKQAIDLNIELTNTNFKLALLLPNDKDLMKKQTKAVQSIVHSELNKKREAFRKKIAQLEDSKFTCRKQWEAAENAYQQTVSALIEAVHAQQIKLAAAKIKSKESYDIPLIDEDVT